MNQPLTHELTNFNDLARQLIADFAAARPMHANSLLITVYGDMICPFGGTIWLGSLIKLVERLGINERLVRTSVYRLTEKGILTSRQRGRRSFYTLTERGLRQFSSASRRIYASAPPFWNGGWQLVMTALGGLNHGQRETVRKELLWLGFSRLAAGFYVHPTADAAVVRRMLEERGVSEQVALLQLGAEEHDVTADGLIAAALEQQQSEVAADYQIFAACFEPLLLAVRVLSSAGSHTKLDTELCFLVRTLLIHQYRHILLREAERPVQLLSANAAGRRARAIVRELYLCLSAPADEYFLSVAESVDGVLPAAMADYFQRFADTSSINASDVSG